MKGGYFMSGKFASLCKASSFLILFMVFLFMVFAFNGIVSAENWFFNPRLFRLRDDPVLDLSFLNEDQAGQSGFIGLSEDGNNFVLGNGEPVRFWAVSTTVQQNNPRDLEDHARFLAQRGVNMVRYHAALNPKGENTEVTDVDDKVIDEIWQLVAAMKDEGIYTTISPFWPHAGHMGGHVPEEWGIEGYAGDNVGLWGLLFFNEQLQKGYQAWIEKLYTEENPYTGIPLAEDPAVGIIQIMNEDSLLFWTEQDIREPQRKILGQKFAEWLIDKYGDLETAYQSWDQVDHEDDNFAEGVVGLNIIWQMTQPQTGGMARRLDDQLQFYAETMYNFNEMMADFYRELGCQQLINPNNWRPADMIRLNDAERWSYTANEVIALNRYFTGGFHDGDHAGWRIDPGDTFGNTSATLIPRNLPVNIKQVEGHPHMITESAWVDPLAYQAEGPLLIAAYQSLTGQDAYYWFNTGTVDYHKNPYHTWHQFEDGQHPKIKWNIATPATMGNFPAAALAYRQGYITEGEPVVSEKRAMEDIWQRKSPIIAEDSGYDPNRDLREIPERSQIEEGVDPLSYLVGPVRVKYGADPADSSVIEDLADYIDRNNKIINSVTGELSLDYGRGIFTLDNQYIKAVAGFASQEKDFNFGNIKMEIENEYISVIVTSLDGQKLQDSQEILIQAGTVVRPRDWEDKPYSHARYPDAREVVNTGRLPWEISKNRVKLTFSEHPAISLAKVINLEGRVVEEIEIENESGYFEFQLPENTMYVILQ